jgi:hypothetical protein
LFQVFSQSERTLDRSEGGLGVGLTLVRRLVELHDGTVWAESDGPNQGSEFNVMLPRIAFSGEIDRSDDSSRRAVAPLKARILVVDDNRDAADSLCELLRLLGHDTQVAGDGVSALGVMKELNRPSCFSTSAFLAWTAIPWPAKFGKSNVTTVRFWLR